MKPFAPKLQQWVVEKFIWLYEHKAEFSTQDYGVVEAIEDCLVDILTCDNASWDTPMKGFKENLEKLEALLMEGDRYHNRRESWEVLKRIVETAEIIVPSKRRVTIKAVEKAEGLIEQIVTHAHEIATNPNSRAVVHWTHEIVNWINTIIRRMR